MSRCLREGTDAKRRVLVSISHSPPPKRQTHRTIFMCDCVFRVFQSFVQAKRAQHLFFAAHTKRLCVCVCVCVRLPQSSLDTTTISQHSRARLQYICVYACLLVCVHLSTRSKVVLYHALIRARMQCVCVYACP